MAAKISQSLEEQVTCPICLGQYQDPRILPCLHTYCRRCLENMLEKGHRRFSIRCPECREIAKILSIDTLKVNIWVNRNISILKLSKVDKNQGGDVGILCTNCDLNELAKAKCFDCDKFMCSACITAHRRMSALKHHQLIDLDEIRDKGIPVVDKPSLCNKHKEKKQKLFCKKCEILICKDCTLVDHKEHDYCFIEDIVQEHRDKLQTEIKAASLTQGKVEAGIKAVQVMQKKVKKNVKDTDKRIDDIIDKQMQALEEKRISLKQESKNRSAAMMKNLAACEDGLMMHWTGLASAIEFTENVLNKGTNTDVLSMSTQVLSRLAQLSTKPIDEEITADEGKQVVQVDGQMIANSISTFANVVNENDIIPDLAKCEVVWTKDNSGNDSIQLYVKNRLGELLDINERRIDLVSECVPPLLSPHFFQEENGVWTFDLAYNAHPFQPKSCNTELGHFAAQVGIRIDDKPIKGNPIQVCSHQDKHIVTQF